MKRNHKELDNILDDTAAEIRGELIDNSVVESAADRVWARLAKEQSAQDLTTSLTPAAEIRNCADFQSLIPAYLSGNLSTARKLLLEDHTQECIPCRKALKQARTGSVARPASVQTRRAGLFQHAWQMRIAAGLVIVFALAGVVLFLRNYNFGAEATVYAANGPVYRVSDKKIEAVSVGGKIEKGERVRTGREGGATVKLADGSLVEMRERSELSLTENSGGTTVHLDRGSVIVQAAKQHEKHLYVATDDALVSVTGTIFSVNNGTKGSRVSVAEGEVHVNYSGQEDVLHPGDQTTTQTTLERVPVQQEFAWSSNAERYTQLLSGLGKLQKDLQQVQRPSVRYSTRFLDMMPEGTVLYAALPNLATTLTESHRIMQERIGQNPALREWWTKERGRKEGGAELDQMMNRIHQFGEYLGSEIVVGAEMDKDGNPVGPYVVGELRSSDGFREFVQQQFNSLSSDKRGPALTFIDDPLTVESSTQPAQNTGERKTNDEILVWVQKDFFVAAPKLDLLKQLAQTAQSSGANNFKQSAFYNRIADIYREGAGLIVAADLERITPVLLAREAKESKGQSHEEVFKQMGLTNLKDFVFEQKNVETKTQTRAVLTFNEQRQGIASWLAAPGPMEGLEFISPDANAVAAFVVKEPTALVDDLLGYMEKAAPDLRKHLDEQQAKRGINLRNDLAAPLGSEFAFAIDGPILPTPSWKVVFEVYDQAKLQQTFQKMVDEVNREAGARPLRLEQAEVGGRTYYVIRYVGIPVEFNYTYANGYLVAAPTRALVEQALRYRESGVTLLRSPRFRSALPEDGNANFSAIVYHDLAPLVQPLAQRMAGSTQAQNLSPEQQAALKALAEAPPTLAYAYAQGDRIIFAANTEGGPFGIGASNLVGMPNAFELERIIGQSMNDKGAKK